MDKTTSKCSRYEYQGQDFDRMLHAWIGQYTGWISPVSFGLAFSDWLANLAISPAKQVDIMKNAANKTKHLLEYAANLQQQTCEPCVACRAEGSSLYQ